MEVTSSATLWLCWYVELVREIITLSFLQVTLVAGPPLDVQFRVCDVWE